VEFNETMLIRRITDVFIGNLESISKLASRVWQHSFAFLSKLFSRGNELDVILCYHSMNRLSSNDLVEFEKMDLRISIIIKNYISLSDAKYRLTSIRLNFNSNFIH